MVCFGLAIVSLVGVLISSGANQASTDAESALNAGGRSTAAALGQAVGNLPSASGGGSGAGPVGQPGASGQSGNSPPPQLGQNGNKIGNGGEIKVSKNTEIKVDKKFGGAIKPPDPNAPAKDPNAPSKPKVDIDVKIADYSKEAKNEGAVGTWKPVGNEQVQGLYGKANAKAGGSLSLKDGAQVNAGAGVAVAALRETGSYTLPGNIQEAHEIKVLSADAKVDGKIGISQDVIGAQGSAGATANLVEGKISANRTFTIPFTNFGVELGGEASGAVGAQAKAEGQAGYFKGDDGKRRFGGSLGAKLGFGLGGGLKLGINLVW